MQVQLFHQELLMSFNYIKSVPPLAPGHRATGADFHSPPPYFPHTSPFSASHHHPHHQDAFATAGSAAAAAHLAADPYNSLHNFQASQVGW
jgi:hypothetical protein